MPATPVVRPSKKMSQWNLISSRQSSTLSEICRVFVSEDLKRHHRFHGKFLPGWFAERKFGSLRDQGGYCESLVIKFAARIKP